MIGDGQPGGGNDGQQCGVETVAGDGVEDHGTSEAGYKLWA